jgi:hypothetical protein
LREVGRAIHYSVEERTAAADEREHYNLKGVGRAIHYSVEERTATAEREHYNSRGVGRGKAERDMCEL